VQAFENWNNRLRRLLKPHVERATLHGIAFSLCALSLAGCTQTLDDLREEAREVPAKLLSDMKAKGMSQQSPVLVRIFKMESELEIWKVDRSGKYALLKKYPMCRWSGKLGPKTTDGDRQAPEGFYSVSTSRLNPKSQFFLSFNLGYPNRLEEALGYTGEALMVHGACSSSGCYAMSDQGIGEIYAVVENALHGRQTAFQVQAYPFRMTPKNLAMYRNDPNMPFWKNLKEGYDAFEVTRREPRVSLCGKKYVFNATFAGGEPSNPLDACPPRIDQPDLAVTAKTNSDIEKADLITANSPQPLAYEDGGMHPNFRTLLEQDGAAKFSKRISTTKYPISRPAAALADPFMNGG